jgi:hypothetical protein
VDVDGEEDEGGLEMHFCGSLEGGLKKVAVYYRLVVDGDSSSRVMNQIEVTGGTATPLLDSQPFSFSKTSAFYNILPHCDILYDSGSKY